jgi:hypothetical protein
VEVQGPPSEAIVISTTDTFPPAVPQGLVAVADAAAGAIDLSWSPDSDSDLAAYHVYRRDVHGGLPPQRIASVGYRDVISGYRSTTRTYVCLFRIGHRPKWQREQAFP